MMLRLAWEIITITGAVASLDCMWRTEQYLTAQSDGNIIRFFRASGFILGSWLCTYLALKSIYHDWMPCPLLFLALAIGVYQIVINDIALHKGLTRKATKPSGRLVAE